MKDKEDDGGGANVVQLGTEERRRRILAVFRHQEFARIQELSQNFGVSEVTIRSDIDVLARKGGLRRVRGGVMRSTEMFAENRYEDRSLVNHAKKMAIGTAAAAMLRPNNSLILDVGTTAMEVAKAIVAREDLENLTVFTNGLNIALALEPAIPRIQIIVTGGVLRPLQHSLVEPMATMILERVRASIAFIGCNAIDADRGVLITNAPEMAMKRHMLRASERHVLIADASKSAQTALLRMCGFDEFDVLVTAGRWAPDVLQRVSDTGLEIIDATGIEAASTHNVA